MSVQLTDEMRQAEIRETKDGYIVTNRRGIAEFKKTSKTEWQYDVYTSEGRIGIVTCVGQSLQVTNMSGVKMMEITGNQVQNACNAIRCSIVAEHVLNWYTK